MLGEFIGYVNVIVAMKLKLLAVVYYQGIHNLVDVLGIILLENYKLVNFLMLQPIIC
mgnify:CR=1 FL=1